MNEQAGRVTQYRITAWWVLGLAALSCLLTLVTFWSVVAQLLVGGYAVYRLTGNPPRRDQMILIAAIALIVVTLLVYTAAGLALFTVERTFQEGAVPIG